MNKLKSIISRKIKYYAIFEETKYITEKSVLK